MLTKQRVIETIGNFPDTFSIDELIEKLIFLEKVERGMLQSENGESISEEELDQEMKKMVQIKWTPQSIEDLRTIYEYIAKDSLKYAKIQTIKLRARTRILQSNPYAGKIVPELEMELIRELVMGNYRIIYKIIDDQTIDIITIHHSARDLSKRQIKR